MTTGFENEDETMMKTTMKILERERLVEKQKKEKLNEQG
jgi:hypothetical protein